MSREHVQVFSLIKKDANKKYFNLKNELNVFDKWQRSFGPMFANTNLKRNRNNWSKIK